MRFEWDDLKNLENLEKHQISFEEAQMAFMDSNRLILKDEKHSQSEDRYFCIGIVDGRIATIRLFHDARGSDQNLWGWILERG